MLYSDLDLETSYDAAIGQCIQQAQRILDSQPDRQSVLALAFSGDSVDLIKAQCDDWHLVKFTHTGCSRSSCTTIVPASAPSWPSRAWLAAWDFAGLCLLSAFHLVLGALHQPPPGPSPGPSPGPGTMMSRFRSLSLGLRMQRSAQLDGGVCRASSLTNESRTP